MSVEYAEEHIITVHGDSPGKVRGVYIDVQGSGCVITPREARVLAAILREAADQAEAEE